MNIHNQMKNDILINYFIFAVNISKRASNA